MTNKQKQTAAIVAAALTWSIALYTIFGPSGGSTPDGAGQPPPDEDEVYEGKLPAGAGEYVYDPSGIPDPFGGYEKLQLKPKTKDLTLASQVEPDLSQLKLAGIIWDDVQPFAVVLTPDGQSHNVKTGDVVSGEKVVSIKEDSILVEKKFQSKTLKFILKQGSQKKL